MLTVRRWWHGIAVDGTTDLDALEVSGSPKSEWIWVNWE